jgi:hypothetical protein
MQVEIIGLKENLRTLIREVVRQFKVKNGVTPSRIDINIIKTTNHGSVTREYEITHVNVEFNL